MLRDDQIRSDLAKLKEIVAAHKAPQADLATHREIIGGIEYDVFTKAPPNLYELYRKGLQSADETFLVYQEDRYTFAETLDRAARMGRILPSFLLSAWLASLLVAFGVNVHGKFAI